MALTTLKGHSRGDVNDYEEEELEDDDDEEEDDDDDDEEDRSDDSEFAQIEATRC